MSNKINRPNRLYKEKSPYLLQYSQNPVDWYPWGDEAFSKAVLEDKPVFLSIGYSSCHWCHVMEHESFEDGHVAGLLNDAFVCIKVDREERPDIDNIYMSVCMMMTGSGGWPLTIIMTPEKKPFFAATYIPRESRWGRPGLTDLIPRVKEAWTVSRKELENSAVEIISAINRDIIKKDIKFSPDIFSKAYLEFKTAYDFSNGGFGKAPKFPSVQNLLFLLRYWKSSREENALTMVTDTLKKMRYGGIFDHIGFGFHRYSTDAGWLVPHFEKMLYDQAMLVIAYAEAFHVTGDIFFRSVCDEILAYVSRVLTSPEGAFYSAEDADSGGGEGKFYLWSYSEISELLSENELDLALKIFNVRKDGNYTEEHGSDNTGKNILNITGSGEKIIGSIDSGTDEVKEAIKNIRNKLFSAREKRAHPFKDDKILTDWNGLMISAFAIAGRIFNNNDYINAAGKAASFIRKNLWLKENRLLHRFREGEAAVTGNLDDYAFVLWGFIELYQATLKSDYLDLATGLADVLMSHFTDEKSGLFYFTPDDGEDHIARMKMLFDAAIPSGNSAAFYNLVRLGRMTGNLRITGHVNKIAGHAPAAVGGLPSGHAMFLAGLLLASGESMEIVISGDPGDRTVQQMLESVNRHYLPDATLVFIPAGEDPPVLQAKLFTEYRDAANGRAAAFVCKGNTCSSPVYGADDLEKLLG